MNLYIAGGILTMNKELLEKELRYILSDAQYEIFKKNVREHIFLFSPGNTLLEMTIMYDNPNPALTFYSKDVDGRLRLRTSKVSKGDIFDNTTDSVPKSMLTWKQRIPDYADTDVRVEKEIEVHFDQEESDFMSLILSDVLKCPRISSYERYRETFYTDEVEIASDLFPYGHVVELELKHGVEENLVELAKMLGLTSMSRSRLSCDDLYKLLCKKAGIQSNQDILFADKAMPKINDFLREIIPYL